MNEYKLVSRIKRVFSDEVIKLIAATCDSKTIGSDQDKVMILRSILKTYKITNYMLGGATNRAVFFIDAYAYKIALNHEGYRDNLMEYAVARDPELEGLVTKSYETNGYILVAECVKALTQEDFSVRKREIIRKLDTISTKYLFHDVGTDKKNFTNWGIRDNGDLVMLDYAYMHRATEGLFTCDHCGTGILTYNATFSYLICNNRAGSCTKSYTYNERKTTQGVQVDIDRMNEAKQESIVIPAGETEKIVSMYSNGRVIDKDTIVIETEADYIRYIKEVNNKMDKDFDREMALDDIIDMMKNNNDDEPIKVEDRDIQTTVVKSKNKIAIMFDIDEVNSPKEEEHDDYDDDDWTKDVVPLSDVVEMAAQQAKREREQVIDNAITQLDAIDAVVNTMEEEVDKDGDGIMPLCSKEGGEA